MRQFQQRSEHLAQAYKDRLLMRTIRKGTKGMREAGEQFLPRSMAEQPYETEHGKYDPYQARLKRSVFANFTKDAIKKLCAKPFSTTMTAETKSKRKAATDLMEQIKTNIDGSGTSLHNFFRKIKVEGAWNGLCHGFVDADSNGKPYARVVHPDTILDAQELNGELVILTFSEDTKEMAEDGLSIKTVKRERTYRKFNGVVEWALFEEGEDHHPKQVGEWTIFGGGNINEIPLFTYYADVDESAEFMSCESPFQDMADLNHLHYQKESDLSQTEHIANIPILFAKGLDPDKPLKIGSDNMIMGTSEFADMYYVGHDAKGTGSTRTSINSLEFQMQTLCMEFVTNKQGAETATGRAISADGNNCLLAAMALNLADMAALVINTMAKFNLVDDLDVTINIHTDFGVTMSSEELKALEKAYEKGTLTSEEYLTELKRRGVLRAAFNIEDNLTQIAANTVDNDSSSSSSPVVDVPDAA